MRAATKVLILCALPLIAGCMSAKLKVTRPDGKTLPVTFYTGNQLTGVDDLLVIEGKNYYGTVGYQMNDPLGDLSFRFEDGKKVQGECVEPGKNLIDQPECKLYKVYRSNFDLIPEGSTIPRPDGI